MGDIHGRVRLNTQRKQSASFETQGEVGIVIESLGWAERECGRTGLMWMWKSFPLDTDAEFFPSTLQLKSRT